MAKKPKKTAIYVEVYPSEKEAFENAIRGKFHSVADAIRDYMRNIISSAQKSQEKSGAAAPI